VVYLPYKMPSMGHISIKLNIQSPFLKIMNGCNIIVQAIINCNKIFTNLFVCLHGNVNDFKVLKRSTLHKHAQYHGLFEQTKNLCDFLLGDKGYPLISWIMIPCKKERWHTIVKLLYNRKHKHQRSIVDNYFSMGNSFLGWPKNIVLNNFLQFFGWEIS